MTQARMTQPLVVDDSRPSVVRVTLNSAGTHNRLDDAMIQALAGVFDQAGPAARVLVIEAAGDAFCSGISLGDVGDTDWRPRITAVRALLDQVALSPLVTVAVVNGPAHGGGVGFAAACDVVIAGPRASFRMTEVLLGLIPAIALPILARRVGPHRSYGLALTAQELSAAEAVQIGLADRFAADPERELRQLLVRLRSADQTALRALKRYYAEQFVSSPDPELTVKVLGEQLDDPRVRERLTRFHREGVIP